MKSQIALISVILLATACNGGGAGDTASKTSSADNTSNNNSGGNSGNGGGAGNSGNNGGNSGNGNNTSNTAMQDIVDAINNDNGANTVYIKEDFISSNEVDVPVYLKCTKPILADAPNTTWISDYLITESGKKYILSGKNVLCVPQKIMPMEFRANVGDTDTHLDLVISNNLDRLSVFDRNGGDVDYVVAPGTFENRKYASIASNCKIQGPVTDPVNLEPLRDTCVGKGLQYGGVNYSNEISATIVAKLGMPAHSINRDTMVNINQDFGFANLFPLSMSNVTPAPSANYIGYNDGNNGSLIPYTTFQAHSITIQGGVPRLTTLVEESIWATGFCKNDVSYNNCSIDGKVGQTPQ